MTTIQSPVLRWTLIVVRVLLGLMFLAAGAAKLSGAPMMVDEFTKVGFGQGFRYVTALIEIAGALLLIMPQTVKFGAGLLLCVAIGAGIAQLTVLHLDVIHCIILAALAAWLVWSYRNVGRAVT